MIDLGSFYWYQAKKDEFFRALCAAVTFADSGNLTKLTRIFPHIIFAHMEVDWERSPITGVETISNLPREKFVVQKGCGANSPEEGSFYWAQGPAGHFMSSMANTVIYADEHNKGMIRKEFPKLVQAYEMEDWNVSPGGWP